MLFSKAVLVTMMVADLANTHPYLEDQGERDGSAPDCIFDQIQPDHVPRSLVRYDSLDDRRTRSSYNNVNRDMHFPWWKSGRLRRQTEQPILVYRPIRIVPFFIKHSEALSALEEERLRNAVHAAILKVKKTLSVIPVKEPLLFPRNGCRTQWRTGKNMGKCSNVENNYRGERCTDSPDSVKIPDEHLSGLYTWDMNGSIPVEEHFSPGPGIPQADFVLYVQSSTSPSCSNGERLLRAYTTNCRLDQNDRPIASSINFCPQQLRSPRFNERKAFLTAMHELFHALGFVSRLFEKFRDCSHPENGCVRRNNVVGVFKGVDRLLTPAVIHKTQQHFDCPGEQDFGAPLEMMNKRPSSHWHPRFLQGSLMAPTIGLDSLTFLDTITLALFEDSGWYKVDYTQADDYKWGKGAGCNFGLSSSCETYTDYFCTGSDVGCHYTHLTKGHCDTNVDLTPCRIYTAKKESNCTLASPAALQNQPDINGEVYSQASSCFIANLTNTTGANVSVTAAGRCYLYRCSDVNRLLVRTEHSDWHVCPFDTDISVPGFNGYLRCPKEGVLCTEADFTTRPALTHSTAPVPSDEQDQTTTTPYTPTPVTRIHTPYDSAEILPVVIVFSTLSLDVLEEQEMIATFVEAVITFVVMITKIVEERIQNVDVKSGSVRLVFDILPAQNEQEGPCTKTVYNILQQYVDQGNFTIQLPTLGQHTAAEIKKHSALDEPTHHSSTAVGAGAIVGIVVGALAFLVIVVIVVIAINKYKLAPSTVNPSPCRKGATGCSTGVVYTHGQERVNLPQSKKTPKKVSFTDLEEVVSQGSGDR